MAFTHSFLRLYSRQKSSQLLLPLLTIELSCLVWRQPQSAEHEGVSHLKSYSESIKIINAQSQSARRRGQQAAHPKDRLPVGTRASQDPNASISHIQIVPRYDDEESQSGYEDNTPVHTNQSYLTEVDPGLDLHQRDSHLRQHSGQTTFADMARAGVGGPDHHTSGGDFMASQEPQSLNNFVRFKKKKGRQWTPIDEENSCELPAF